MGGTHFMAEPAALAFGAPGWLATAQEQDQPTQPDTPVDFMGPTLWTADSGIFNAGTHDAGRLYLVDAVGARVLRVESR
jgi:hypothetical protein